MVPGIFDHALFVVVTLFLPIYAFREYRRLVAEVESGDPGARARGYIETMVIEWALCLLVLVRWYATGRLATMMGPGSVGGVQWWIGTGAATLGCALLVYQTAFVLKSETRMAQARTQLEPLRTMIPATPREGRLFNWLSITAGVCEEVIYRGFLITYLAAYVPVWGAVVLSSLIFGFGHAYQGASGVLRTGVVGAIGAGFFLLTDSLWAPIVVHAVVDLNSGYLGRRVLNASPVKGT